MRTNNFAHLAAAVTLGVMGSVTAAQASVISATPNTDFTNGSTSFSFSLPGNSSAGSATYSFQDDQNPTAPNFSFGLPSTVSIKTSGDALVASTFGTDPAGFFTGSRAPVISGELPVSGFRSFDDYATVPFSRTDKYVALAADFDDGRHYGYAEVAGPNLRSYGFETVAGQGIQAGATAPASNPVPGPGSLGALGFALGLIGFGATLARRRKS